MNLENLADTYPPGEEPQQVLYLEGLAQFALGRDSEAIDSFASACQRGRPTPEILFRLAEAQVRDGRNADAQASAQRALAIEPNHRPSRSLLEALSIASRQGAGQQPRSRATRAKTFAPMARKAVMILLSRELSRPASREQATMTGFFAKERIIASPGFNRWRIPLASVGIHMCIGSVYAWSIFNPALVKVRGVVASSRKTGVWRKVVWVFTVAIVMLGLSAAVGGKWLERVGPRTVGLLAAVCWCSAFLASSAGVHWHQLWLLYLGYGLIGGVGLGLGYVSPVSTLIRWFPDRRGMATGMAIMGFGGGAMIAAPATERLMRTFYRAGLPGWRRRGEARHRCRQAIRRGRRAVARSCRCRRQRDFADARAWSRGRLCCRHWCYRCGPNISHPRRRLFRRDDGRGLVVSPADAGLAAGRLDAGRCRRFSQDDHVRHVDPDQAVCGPRNSTCCG